MSQLSASSGSGIDGVRRSRRHLVGAAALAAPILFFALLLALLWHPSAASAATLTVCPSGGQYSTIQAAVNAAAPGNVIQICSGVYAESVNLDTMGSGIAGGVGDIELSGVGTVTISSTNGAAIYAYNDFTGTIVFNNLNVTSPDSNAINLDGMVLGDLMMTGGSASHSGGSGLHVYGLQGSVTISSASFSDNYDDGIDVSAQPTDTLCLPGAASAPVLITLHSVTADRNGFSGLNLLATTGDVVITNTHATGNGGDGFMILAFDTCNNSKVTIAQSSANDNGGDVDGTGFNIVAPNVKIDDTDASGNSCDGIAQSPMWGASICGGMGVSSAANDRLRAKAEAGSVHSLSAAPAAQAVLHNITVAGNGAHDLVLAENDYVTVTNVSAISNTWDGIFVPFVQAFIGASSDLHTAGLSPAQNAYIAQSLVMSNDIGIELNDQEWVDAPPLPWQAAGAPASVITANAAGNIVCANQSAGLAATGLVSHTYQAQANYWGNFSGPYHVTQNPAGLGNAVMDADSSGGSGNVVFVPWVDAAQTSVTPDIGIAGAEQTLSATFGAAPYSLAGSPGNPNDDPLFVASTNNGTVKTAYGEGASAPAALDAYGVLTATLVPAAPGGAIVTFSGPCGLMATKTVTVAAPSLAVSKQPAAQAVINGGTATFTINITNTGNIALTNIAAVDLLAPACSRSVNDLAPGAATSFVCQQTGVSVDYTNRITVTAKPQIGGPTAFVQPGVAPQDVVVSAGSSALVDVVNPQVRVVKSAGTDPDTCAPAGPLTAPLNSSIYYCITLFNTGDVTLTNHLVSDPLLGIANAPVSALLPPGSSLAVTRTLVTGLGPIALTGALTNAVAITSTGVVSEVGGVAVPAVAVQLQNAAAVEVKLTPTWLAPVEEPLVDKKLYLPAVGK